MSSRRLAQIVVLAVLPTLCAGAALARALTHQTGAEACIEVLMPYILDRMAVVAPDAHLLALRPRSGVDPGSLESLRMALASRAVTVVPDGAPATPATVGLEIAVNPTPQGLSIVVCEGERVIASSLLTAPASPGPAALYGAAVGLGCALASLAALGAWLRLRAIEASAASAAAGWGLLVIAGMLGMWTAWRG